MLVLGIDPGQKCGWAMLEGSKRLASDTLNLKPGRHESMGMAFLRLRAHLRELLTTWDVSAVAYEEVRAHRGTSAAHWYGGIIAILQAECLDAGVPYRGIPVGTIKKRATGKGNAGKPAMVEAANTEWGIEVKDDNEADALWCAEVLVEELGVMT